MKKEPNPNIVVGSNKKSLLPRLKLPKSKKDPNKPQLVQFDNSAAVKPVIHNRKPLFVAGGVILFIILANSLYSFYQNHKSPPLAHNQCQTGAGGLILQEAAKIINSNQKTQLQPTVSKIQAIKNYDKDPNCLYVIVVYYVSVGDSLNSKKYLDKLLKVYDPKTGFSSKLGKDIEPIKKLQDDVAYLVKVYEQSLKNIHRIKGAD